ncbi:MAG: Ku protein [Vicinamibacterales bacterium]
MAARALWKGSLKLSLIAIPIRVFAATDPAGDISFRQIHEKCGTPIKLKRWCPHCEMEVNGEDLAKGYEFQKGQFVLIDAEDIKAVRPPSTHTIAIAQVIDNDRLDPLFIEKPYYVAPDNAASGAAFAVIRDALGERAAVGKLALHGREYLVALRPRAGGLVMYTLRHGSEVRAIDGIDELQFARTNVKADELKLAEQVLDSFESDADLSTYHDDYEDALRQMIDAKVAGQEIVAPEEPAAPKVVNLMDALRRSLAEVKAGGEPRSRASDSGKSEPKAKPAKIARTAPAATAAAPAKRRKRAS